MFGRIKNLIGSEINGAINSIREQLSFNIGSFKIGYETGVEGLMYPMELRDQPDRPCIEFTAYDTSSGQVDQKTVWFPCPSGIQINDQAAYNTIDLGAFGAAISAKAEGGGLLGTLGAGLKQAGSMKGGEIATLAAGKLGGIGDKVAFNAKAIQNPNTNTNFTGNPVRSFSFAFKMIARSEKEAQQIKKIHSTFRKYTYADSNGNQQNLTLRYPPVWRIRFLDGQKNENQYIPKIHSCYLLGVQSTFNSTAPTFHTDGSPLEVEVSLTYQESRALTRYDIENLGNDDDRGIGADGMATTQLTPQGALNKVNERNF